ncbi:hypothetical protein [Fluviispira multicolorata]|uniref:Uncharacterized protein n=1 Tax=Fluviispira multicolorata TaxID=2654512 RepID=A0A833JEW7_9BACT|nr:hypothetical protein [Fluviispira multicolorata]KAB8032119.1 hypothetical protein GCL57_05585 [Fluviispira multicolorata]
MYIKKLLNNLIFFLIFLLSLKSNESNAYKFLRSEYFIKKESNEKAGFNDFSSLFNEIQKNPESVCLEINQFIHESLQNHTKYHKEIDKSYLIKITKNYSYCFNEELIFKMFNTFMPKAFTRDGQNYLKIRYKPFVDYKAARIIYKRFENFFYEEHFIRLYEYSLVYDVDFSHVLFYKMLDKIFYNSEYICNFVNYTVLASLKNFKDYKKPVNLKYISDKFINYKNCYDSQSIQSMFDMVLSPENRLLYLTQKFGEEQIKTNPYVDFATAKLIFENFATYLTDVQLSLLFEYSLVNDVAFSEKLKKYFSQEIEGHHTLIFHEPIIESNNRVVLVERIMTIL